MSEYLLEQIKVAGEGVGRIIKDATAVLRKKDCDKRGQILIECLRQTDVLRESLSQLQVNEHDLLEDLTDLVQGISLFTEREGDMSRDVRRKILRNRLKRTLFWLDKGAEIKVAWLDKAQKEEES